MRPERSLVHSDPAPGPQPIMKVLDKQCFLIKSTEMLNNRKRRIIERS